MVYIGLQQTQIFAQTHTAGTYIKHVGENTAIEAIFGLQTDLERIVLAASRYD